MGRETAKDPQELANRLDCGIQILFALWAAADRDAFSSGAYAEALFGLYDYLSLLVDELHRVLEQQEAGSAAPDAGSPTGVKQKRHG